MSSSGFQPAEMVELHDSGVCLFPESHTDISGWREFKEYEGQAFSILGEDVCRIARIFGLDPQPIQARSVTGEIGHIDPECLEFKIVKSRQDIGKKTDSRHYGTMERIKTIYARTGGPHLLELDVEFYSLDKTERECTIIDILPHLASRPHVMRGRKGIPTRLRNML